MDVRKISLCKWAIVRQYNKMNVDVMTPRRVIADKF
jgi:hypothetical protein